MTEQAKRRGEGDRKRESEGFKISLFGHAIFFSLFTGERNAMREEKIVFPLPLLDVCSSKW